MKQHPDLDLPKREREETPLLGIRYQVQLQHELASKRGLSSGHLYDFEKSLGLFLGILTFKMEMIVSKS